ncbi:hypothetical protein [Clostridium estertheticum]|uniref:Uncharacterized protein n=1 Tax=Clostridium estertheticum TaxID=238834 RepID=A0A7Y3SWZ5_9CLOT|nr:hypothetical protein [Clostridium estertheticum]MBW9171255.1 hypothetical protein [Clostridium estertheticum]MBX4264774.1 hypothetical protein [Clostridium estertheticum]MBX4269726.1 hypothetical protein [Clostridium estertheticum]NNU76884.1 hypothetical protein [Clostridium estertheticum]WBL48754.1 hypothetical protein LOR37_08865 [Clostridium estertheticum]
MFLLVIIFYIIIIFFETVPLLKEKNRGKTILYFSLIIFSMTISILLSLGVQLPSPSNMIKNIVVSIFGKSN